MPKSNRRGKAAILTRDQIAAIAHELRPPHDAIALLSYWAASRIGEVVAIAPGDIAEGYLILRQTKTRATKAVPIGQEIRAALDSVQGQGEMWLFPGSDETKHLTTRAFQKQLDKVLDWLGIAGASSHSFRRSMATHLYESGVDLESIRQRTGHRSLASLTEYIDIPGNEAESRIERAIASWREKHDPN